MKHNFENFLNTGVELQDIAIVKKVIQLLQDTKSYHNIVPWLVHVPWTSSLETNYLIKMTMFGNMHNSALKAESLDPRTWMQQPIPPMDNT